MRPHHVLRNAHPTTLCDNGIVKCKRRNEGRKTTTSTMEAKM